VALPAAAPTPTSSAASPPAAASSPAPKPATVETSLDEIILSYLIGKEK
jgi:hypothetical protein